MVKGIAIIGAGIPRRTVFSAFLVALAGACGCGTSDGSASGRENGVPQTTRVDLDWFRGSENCFLPVIAEARSCLAAGARGTLSTDRKRCDYGDGTVTDVVNPIPQLGFGAYVWDITVTKNGAMCAHLKESSAEGTSNGATNTFETAAGKVTIGLSGTDFMMTCPDGSSVLTDARTLLNDAYEYWPGIVAYLSFTEVTASEQGDPVGGPARLLDCAL